MISSDLAFEAFEYVRKVSGNTKISTLKGRDVKEYLLAAYDPSKRYYVTKGRIGQGTEQFTDLTWQILDSLQKRTLSGDEAKTIVNVHTQEMTPISSELFRRILRKDLRIGMGAKTINKAFPDLIPTHDVMLAKLYDISRLRLPCFGSPKIDGVRADVKDGKVLSRGGFEYKGVGHIVEEFRNFTKEVTGELVVPGVSFQVGSGWIRSDDLTPDAQFHMIDITTENISFKERLTAMDDLHLIGDHILKVPHKILYTKEEVADYYVQCRNAGYEGAVIKPMDYNYRGTRSYDWMKMKPVDNVDLKVIELYEGKGKYEGQMGGAKVIFTNGEVNRVGGGWSDEQRRLFWEIPSKLISRTIEIFFMEKTDDGNMRHARFIQFREDKD